MGLIGSVLAFLGLLIHSALAEIYLNNSVWNVSNGDQIAFPLYRFFKTNKEYTLNYSVIANFTTKLIAREPFFIREISQNCNSLTPMDRTDKDDKNRLTMICNKNEFYELVIDLGTGRITEVKLVGRFEGQECLGSDWSKTATAYALFCTQKGKTGSAADDYYVLNIIDKIDFKLTLARPSGVFLHRDRTRSMLESRFGSGKYPKEGDRPP
jgi:hypothetical protein